ncbi:hypothetical protein BDF14DRAFT_1762227 [Spinellus fusiger]|nr:hypothetical protein BDF14DRAFT_1762227 [Spinellus fusiger]
MCLCFLLFHYLLSIIYMLYVICYMLYVICYMLYVICYLIFYFSLVIINRINRSFSFHFILTCHG